MKITNYSFGDILLAEIVFTDNTGAKKRPIVIISAQEDDYLVAFITSNKIPRSIWDIPIHQDTFNNLASDWYIRTRKLMTIHEDLIYKQIGHLSKKDTTLLKSTLIENMKNL